MEPATPATAAPLSSPRRVIFMCSNLLKDPIVQKQTGRPIGRPYDCPVTTLLCEPPRPQAEASQPHQPGSQQEQSRRLGYAPARQTTHAFQTLTCARQRLAFGRAEGERDPVDEDGTVEVRDAGDDEGDRLGQVRAVRGIGERAVRIAVGEAVRGTWVTDDRVIDRKSV